jgi:hypothetical protein
MKPRGPILNKSFLGGKWYFFFNYEGLRFPNTLNFSTSVPSALMRTGVIQAPNASGTYVAYNLNPNPVTVNGVSYQPAICPAGSCDPRNIGLNPVISQMWSKQAPLGNNPLGGDTYNTIGFLASIREPLTSNNYVGRIDHDFGDKWHWYATYRDFKLASLTPNQVDIGGVFPSDAFGTPTPTAPRPQQPSVWTTGMTTTISSTATNTFVFSYLRNFWQWSDASGQPQLPGLGGDTAWRGSNGTNIIYGTNGVGAKTSAPYLQAFANPAAVYAEFRPFVLGFDTGCGGGANMRGLPAWDLDADVIKDIGVYKERVGVMLFFTITNGLNHFQPSNPSFSLTSPTTFGLITSQANTPRNMEFGVRVHF